MKTLLLILALFATSVAAEPRYGFLGIAFVSFDKLLGTYVICREGQGGFTCIDVKSEAVEGMAFPCVRSDHGLICYRPNES